MAYRLLFLCVFLYIFAIQARYVRTDLSLIPQLSFTAAWILIVAERRLAIQREVKLLKKEIQKRASK